MSESARIVVAFVPVDDCRSVLYVRFYQSFVRTPVIRGIVNRLAMPFNRKILHQDRRVVETQRPLATGLSIGENLIQADLPIVEYRRRREQLKGNQTSFPSV